VETVGKAKTGTMNKREKNDDAIPGEGDELARES
jgi:hypothetical protein